MRAVRFATRFGFAPDPAIMESASSKEVSHANAEVPYYILHVQALKTIGLTQQRANVLLTCFLAAHT
jgi:hypothetical protein